MEDKLTRLSKLGDLKEKGLVSGDEYERLKADIVSASTLEQAGEAEGSKKEAGKKEGETDPTPAELISGFGILLAIAGGVALFFSDWDAPVTESWGGYAIVIGILAAFASTKGGRDFLALVVVGTIVVFVGTEGYMYYTTLPQTAAEALVSAIQKDRQTSVEVVSANSGNAGGYLVVYRIGGKEETWVVNYDPIRGDVSGNRLTLFD